MATKEEVRQYWERHPNAAALGGNLGPATRDYFEAIEAHRYQAEPCIKEMAEFAIWSGLRVLEVGCGIGTDLRQFAKSGATVVGLDLTFQGVSMTKKAFDLFGLKGDFVVADAEALPFRAEAFDLVYSNGVIHHTPNTPAAVLEIYRVTRHGGQARVMVYHRNSYYRRVLIDLLFIPFVRVLTWVFPRGPLPRILELRIPPLLKNMYAIVLERGFSRETIFASSTDPSWPGEGNANPLSRAYSQAEAKRLFGMFKSSQTLVRQLYYADFLPGALHHRLEHRLGWFLFIRAFK
ncbi:MAG TPA: class I SAM-dependent methyltransferase [Terriglobia bacterium]|nr:class I SAM-dependent methyltransferase [Terriglobia bacterium]